MCHSVSAAPGRPPPADAVLFNPSALSLSVSIANVASFLFFSSETISRLELKLQ